MRLHQVPQCRNFSCRSSQLHGSRGGWTAGQQRGGRCGRHGRRRNDDEGANPDETVAACNYWSQGPEHQQAPLALPQALRVPWDSSGTTSSPPGPRLFAPPCRSASPPGRNSPAHLATILSDLTALPAMASARLPQVHRQLPDDLICEALQVSCAQQRRFKLQIADMAHLRVSPSAPLPNVRGCPSAAGVLPC